MRRESSTQTTPPPQTQVTQKDTATNTDPPKNPPVTHTSSQTTPPTPKLKLPTNSVSTNTDPPPARTYAEAATTTNSPPLRQPLKDKGKAPAKATPPLSTQISPPRRVQAVVLHTAPTKYKPGLMRRWIEEDNKTAQIQGIRWLLKEDRRIGKLASSLVIYMTETIDLTHGLRMGRRLFRTTAYDWGGYREFHFPTGEGFRTLMTLF
ncbi:hypothetical protein L211DRAFT_897332 [Terfezia boudieri ATCC MYA-4762]|uniref:Uncharacterized protein n=1 Tax=Terfezia boudieri ATCC MYA-4762 TaxID=1051890 RepID=A0A3N4LWN0_9PEZI|nr:hypothetical protein L211DRAFT_897332 [Terfezia boudieri ATCC MYA-4762]